ncbi:MAG: hypothetical protein QM639_17740 [Rhodocyclaceae bacterium]
MATTLSGSIVMVFRNGNEILRLAIESRADRTCYVSVTVIQAANPDVGAIMLYRAWAPDEAVGMAEAVRYIEAYFPQAERVD